jgi:signal transduction histidine kinase
MARRGKDALIYALLAGGAAAAGVLISYTALAAQFDNNAYDWFFRLHPGGRRAVEAVVLAIDEHTLQSKGGIRGMRVALAEALERLSAKPPKVVAVDLTLAEAGEPEEDAALEAAFAKTRGLVLASEMMPDASGWQDPPGLFRNGAAAVGHVNALPGPYDDINRRIPLERVAGRQRRWALSVEALRLWKDGGAIEESPADVTVAGARIESKRDEGRPLWVNYRPTESVLHVSLADAAADSAWAEKLQGRVVFVGVTALSAARDRLFTPLSRGMQMTGVEIHAQAFETMANGAPLRSTSLLTPALVASGIAALAALVFMLLQGWMAYAAGALVLLAAHFAPYVFFRQGFVLPAFAPVAAGWLAVIACAAWQHFFVRRQLEQSEAATARYQQALHFVAHEMRTPLTAIQGSSELISRYKLPEEKQKQLGQMINSESKRLAGMITNFLNVERLTAGEMDLRRTDFAVEEVVRACVERARPLAERKRIAIACDADGEARVEGDRELLEYAVYNLVTNAIKYSPAETEVRVAWKAEGGSARVSVKDQGMGMTEQEVKGLFRKFYRTKKAEESGVAGTGIGLSIVDQIVSHHGGRMEVASEPEKGSTFTIVLPARATPGAR